VPIMGPRTHGLWLGSTVFDGARAFEGVTPDLDRHCARVNQSAINFGLKPMVDLDTRLGLAPRGADRPGSVPAIVTAGNIRWKCLWAWRIGIGVRQCF
jgi:branched-subunit amino acid aminotransferase/4-amino-4-deoxychorismate lyase